jgi:hypothetical protein
VDKSAHLSNSVTNVAGRQQLRVDPAILAGRPVVENPVPQRIFTSVNSASLIGSEDR